jgi:hypothetical protein
VFLECGEKLDPEGGHGHEMGSIQWDHGTRVDRDREDPLQCAPWPRSRE